VRIVAAMSPPHEYAAEARASAELEAAAHPAQAARLRAIDRVTVRRLKKSLHPLLVAFVEKAKAGLGVAE